MEESIAIANSTTLFERFKLLLTVPVHRRALGKLITRLSSEAVNRCLVLALSCRMRPSRLSTIMRVQHPHVLLGYAFRDHRLQPTDRRRTDHLRNEFPFHPCRLEIHRYRWQEEDPDLFCPRYGGWTRPCLRLIPL